MWPFKSREKTEQEKRDIEIRNNVILKKKQLMTKLFGRDVSNCSHSYVTYLLIEKVVELEERIKTLENK